MSNFFGAFKRYVSEKKKTRELQDKIRRVQAYNRAVKGGAVGGMSMAGAQGKVESDERAAAARKRKNNPYKVR